jgi:calcineurin-like phosphoesterase family protein
MSTVFFTADTHFGHKNIVKYCNRPFESIEEHDETLIENHNSVVKPGDRVFHNGDISLSRDPQKVAAVVKRLNGMIFVQKGNHDAEEVLNDLTYAGLIRGWRDIRDVKIGHQHIVLSHYALLTWNRGHYGSWMLHGHSHNTLPPTTQPRLDVGVDAWDYKPVSFEEIRETMRDRTFAGVDHHV